MATNQDSLQYDFSGGAAQQPAGGPSSWIPVSSQVPLSDTAAVPVQSPPSDDSHYKGLHPVAAFFHAFFKALAIILFFFGSLLFSTITCFIIIVLLLSIDFWVTKNVTGRLLVSLRWWSEVREDGSSTWMFESATDEESRVNSYDRWFFWIVLGGNTAVWLLLLILNFLSLSNLPITMTGFILGCVNIVGYAKCRREKGRLADVMLRQAAQRPEFIQKAAQAVFS